MIPRNLDGKRYAALKAKIRAGIRIPREDFLFVKSIDMLMSSRRYRAATRGQWK